MTTNFLSSKRLSSIFILVALFSISEVHAQISYVTAALRDPYNADKVYLFQGDDYYEYSWSNNIGYRKSIILEWNGIPGKIDAAVQDPTNRDIVYLFRGNQYYKYDWKANRVSSGYPKSTSTYWPGLPGTIDAAICDPTNSNVLYFFSGSNYYKFEWSANKVPSGYPKSISGNWPGLPGKVDAALRDPKNSNQVYCFSGANYYRYNWKDNRVDAGYPKSTAENWKTNSDNIRNRDLYTAVYVMDKVQSIAGTREEVQNLAQSDKNSLSGLFPSGITGGYTASSYLGQNNDSGQKLDFFVVETSDQVVIAFRGSTTSGNWMNNFCIFDARPDFDNHLVQICYAKTAVDYYNKIKARTSFTGKQLILTGHSQGGATAGLLMYLFLKNGLLDKTKSHRLVTQCAPRYTSAGFRTSFWNYAKSAAPLMSCDALEVDGDPVTNSLAPVFMQEKLMPLGNIRYCPVSDSPLVPFDRHTDSKYRKDFVTKLPR